MPYKRIAVYEDVAKLERRTSKMLQVSYIDELQDKYEAHFEFLKAHFVPQIQGTLSLIQILNTLKYSAYLDEDLVSLTVGAYKNNLASPITDRVGLLGLSHVLSRQSLWIEDRILQNGANQRLRDRLEPPPQRY